MLPFLLEEKVELTEIVPAETAWNSITIQKL